MIALILALASSSVSAEPAAEAWARKVDPWVLESGRSAQDAEFLIVLEQQADVSGAARLRGQEAKGRYVFEQLRATAARTQPAVLQALAAREIEHRPFYVANMIWARGDLDDVRALASRSDVARLSANPTVRLDVATVAPEPAINGACPPTIEASLTHVGAPDLWALGFDGSGIVVAGQDTGYDWDHEALKSKYLGWDGANAVHDYHWHDAIHSGGGVCGADSVEPCDDNGHGTHTMGTMVGSTATSTVGMAPGARWIGCRNMDRGNGTPATYTECFQFFLAPTDSAGNNPDPGRAPQVINNSWGCPPSEGCTDPNVLRTVVENLRAAGIVVVVSAGNSGSSCESVNTAAAIYDASFTVGSSQISDSISSFSSRGPVTIDGSDRIKPDITAPGSSICSSFPGDSYGTISGTSMAGPHVAGLVALVLDAGPCLIGDPDGVEAHIIASATPTTSGQTCGGLSGSVVPNNTFGHGIIHAAVPDTCGPVFTDGFETGNTSAWSPIP